VATRRRDTYPLNFNALGRSSGALCPVKEAGKASFSEADMGKRGRRLISNKEPLDHAVSSAKGGISMLNAI